jgi:small subunit ribosomal protein S17
VEAEERRPNQTLTGVVVSDRMDKTVVVLVNRLVKHPVYKKYIRRRARFMATTRRT